jgi:hypothetical protein
MIVIKTVIIGVSISFMALAIGIESFSGEWWTFIIAANALVIACGAFK